MHVWKLEQKKLDVGRRSVYKLCVCFWFGWVVHIKVLEERNHLNMWIDKAEKQRKAVPDGTCCQGHTVTTGMMRLWKGTESKQVPAEQRRARGERKCRWGRLKDVCKIPYFMSHLENKIITFLPISKDKKRFSNSEAMSYSRKISIWARSISSHSLHLLLRKS